MLLIPRWVDCNRATFKYGLGDEFIDVLQTLHKLGLDKTDPVAVRGQQVSPRDVVAACLPDPATLGPQMSGKTCAGTWVTGTGTDGSAARGLPVPRGRQRGDVGARQAPGGRVADGDQPGLALELLANGAWSGAGVLGPEAFEPVPFLDLLTDYGSPWGMEERTPSSLGPLE